MTGPVALERVPSLPTPSTSRRLREIFFPSDLSSAADRAEDHARLLAERFQALLVLYHAVEVEMTDGVSDSGDRERVRRRERQAHEHLLRQAERARTRRDVRVDISPSASDSVVDMTRALRPDLAVMATHGRRGLAHFMIGSVVERVLQETAVPVLCVREPEHGVALPYRRILVPTDLTHESRRAFRLAAAMARVFSAEVIALHVPAVTVGRTTAGVTEAVENVVPSEAALAAFLLPEFDGIRIAPRIVFGSAWPQILGVAHDERVDLIALSTHRRDSLTDRVLGTHAERVVREAPCPVLVV
jgi:nucleotide-binding universal stress UspA family protein